MLLNKWKTLGNHKLVINIYFIVICYCISFIKCENIIEEYDGNSGLYSIEGKVYAPEIYSSNDFNWQRDTVITINNGEYSGFLKEDGTFVISGIPSGSYVVEVSNPDYYYESVSWLSTILLREMIEFFVENILIFHLVLNLGSGGNQSEG